MECRRAALAEGFEFGAGGEFAATELCEALHAEHLALVVALSLHLREFSFELGSILFAQATHVHGVPESVSREGFD